MNHADNKNSLSVMASTLGWPLLGGSLGTVAFYGLLQSEVINSSLVRRYFMGHPVEYLECFLFFVGLAALLAKGRSVWAQFGTLADIELPEKPQGGLAISQVRELIDSLMQMPAHVRSSYFVRRLVTALEYVSRKESSDGLEQELKHQSELDAVRQHESYALVRIIIWATPMLGFLGTVIGITLALGDLSPQSLVNTPEQAMEGLLGGLSVAFDTTAVALTLSMLLMFCQFVTHRLESELLESVDARIDRELIGRFADATGIATAGGPPLEGLQRHLTRAIENLSQRQIEIWQAASHSSQQQWDHVIQLTGSHIEAAIQRALQRSIHEQQTHAQQQEHAADDRIARRWDAFQEVLTQNAQVMQAQQAELVRQGDLILQSVQAAQSVSSLQRTLNDNLSSLALAGKFEDTMMGLSAAIHLLNGRLNPHQDAPQRVRLYREDGVDRRAA